MTNVIKWERWKDPLLARIEKLDKDDESDFDRDDFLDRDEDELYDHPYRQKSIAFVSSFGVIPITESNVPSSLFTFYMGHANFDLTLEMQDVIEAVPGVESLDINTRYRFRVGIGKSFDAHATLAAIDAAVNPPAPVIEEPKKASPIDAMKNVLQKKFHFWGIAEMEDGTTHVAGGRTAEEVCAKLSQYATDEVRLHYSWSENDASGSSHKVKQEEKQAQAGQ